LQATACAAESEVIGTAASTDVPRRVRSPFAQVLARALRGGAQPQQLAGALRVHP